MMRCPVLTGGGLGVVAMLPGSWVALLTQRSATLVDVQLATNVSCRMFFFFTAAPLLINVNDYCIDKVLWRFLD
jgi:hypothetical protein